MFTHVTEIANLLARWIHLIAGIMWIGNSMLFNWIDRNLIPKPEKKGSVGEIWMVHSGGFYQMEKLYLEPSAMPKTLHWFKWQNGVTWLSGISLLILIYYLGASSMLIDPEVADISPTLAVGISAGSLLVAWLAYAGIWKSPIGQSPGVASALSVAVVLIVSAVYFHFFSGRAAYLHVGVLLGTLMTGNVWFVIMPSQRELIAATLEGREQSPAIGYQAKERSIHNNYMTFPLLFIMLSGHFPQTYTHPQGWLILLILTVGSASIRHFMNVRFTTPLWLYPAGAIGIITVSLVFVMISDRDLLNTTAKRTTPVAFEEVAGIVHERCVPCHSQKPTNDTYKTAPNGVMFDSADDLVRKKDQIKERVVLLKNMPLANITKMTPEERATLGAWIEQGAKGPEAMPAAPASASAAVSPSAARAASPTPPSSSEAP